MNPVESTLLSFLIKPTAINENCEFFMVLRSGLLGSFQNFMVGPDDMGQHSDIHRNWLTCS